MCTVHMWHNRWFTQAHVVCKGSSNSTVIQSWMPALLWFTAQIWGGAQWTLPHIHARRSESLILVICSTSGARNRYSWDGWKTVQKFLTRSKVGRPWSPQPLQFCHLWVKSSSFCRILGTLAIIHHARHTLNNCPLLELAVNLRWVHYLPFYIAFGRLV